jgi:hypothetical protein
MSGPPIFMMGEQPKPPPELLAHIEKLNAAQADFERTARLQCLTWASLLCTCRLYFDWNDRSAPQHGCMIHHSVMISPAGDVIG